MQVHYVLDSREKYPLVRVKNSGTICHVDYLEIFRFTPRDGERTVPVNTGVRGSDTGS